MLPVFDDGSVLFAMHQQRDLEVAGGHIEPGEDAMSAAIRETLEETGGEVKDIQPIGYLRMTSSGKVTDPWPYPHPLSYQQFFAGRVVKQHEYMANDECAKPVRISGPFDALMGTMKISACLFAKRAVETFNEK
jgi:8-oxo-dGTP pyrophosphatase MutT (NUDIX family)